MSDSILVCVDLKHLSRHVVEWSIKLSKRMGTSITLIHVREESPTSEHATANHASQSAKELVRENNELAKLEEIIRDSQLEYKVEQPQGDLVPMLLKEVEQSKPLFVVMGSEHNSALHHLVSGSIPAKVMGKAKIPLFLVPVE